MRRIIPSGPLAMIGLLLTALPLVAQPATAPAASPPKTQEALPPARQIIERHLKAIGGREGLRAHTSRRAVGTFSMGSTGLGGPVEVFAAAPNKSLERSTIAGVGDVQLGFDGTVGWQIDPMLGPRLLQGRELEELREAADFNGDLEFEQRYTSMTTVGRTDFEGRPCYEVRLVRRSGREETHYYDAATGLRAGITTTKETAMGSVAATVVETEYKQFGRIKLATRLTSKMMGQQIVTTIGEVEFDKVDPAVFALPPQIKALVK